MSERLQLDNCWLGKGMMECGALRIDGLFIYSLNDAIEDSF